MARRQATEQINVRFTPQDLEALAIVQAETGERVSEILRRLVREEASRLRTDQTQVITLSTRL